MKLFLLALISTAWIIIDPGSFFLCFSAVLAVKSMLVYRCKE